MTSGLEDQYGDVHLNSTTRQYWVFSSSWEMKSEISRDGDIQKVAFVHPECKKNPQGGKYTWDTTLLKWNKHEQNKGKLPGSVEVKLFILSQIVSQSSLGTSYKG